MEPGDVEEACIWMDTKFGKDEGQRKRKKDPYWMRQMNAKLMEAVETPDLEQEDKWLSYGASPNAKYRQTGDTAVHVATGNGDVTILQRLLAAEGSPKAKNKKGQEPIHVAVQRKDKASIAALCEIDPTVVNNIIFLMEDGTDSSNAHDLDACDSIDVYENLISLECNENGLTPLHIASMRNAQGIIELLIVEGAKVARATATGLTPLDVVGIYEAKNCYPHDNLEDDFRSVCSVFLKNKLAMPKTDQLFVGGKHKNAQRYTTALHTAVTYNYCLAIEELLNEGACLGVWDINGETAIHLAISMKLMTSLTTILTWNEKNKRSLELNVRNRSGLTPLQLAALLGLPNYVAVLLEGGADASLTALVKNDFFVRLPSQSNSILEYFVSSAEDCRSQKSSWDGTLALTIDHEKPKYQGPLKLTACYCAVLGNSLDCLQILSADGKPLTHELDNNMNLLHLAAWCNAPEIMKFLLDKFRELKMLEDKRDQMCHEGTGLYRFAMAPIHFASFQYADGEKIIKLLVEEGECDIKLAAESKDYGSNLPLHFATRTGIWKHVKLIYNYDKEALNRTCERREGDQQVLKVPHLAAIHSHGTLREFLLRGADLSSTAEHGNRKDTLAKFVEMYVDNPVEFLEEILDLHMDLEHLEITDSKIGSHDTYLELNYPILAPRGEDDSQMRVLDALVSSDEVQKKQSLLLHPLTESFIYLKWQKLKTFYTIHVFFQLLVTVLITTLGCLRYVDENQQYGTFAEILKYFLGIVITVVFVLNSNIGHKKIHKYLWFIDFHTLTWFTMVFLSILMVFTDQSHQWGRGVAALAILLSWIELIYLLARYPWTGKYPLGYNVVMFLAVVSNFAQVAVSFFVLFVAFALSFLVLLGHDEEADDEPNPFKTPMKSFFKTITMIDNFEDQPLFKSSYLAQTESENFVGSILGSVVFLGFLFLMTIAMMNFMTGVAIEDIATLRREGKARHIFEQAQTLIRLENMMNRPFLKQIGFETQVKSKQRVWLKDCIHKNVDIPENLVLAVFERVRIIKMNEEKKLAVEKNEEKGEEKGENNERNVEPPKFFR